MKSSKIWKLFFISLAIISIFLVIFGIGVPGREKSPNKEQTSQTQNDYYNIQSNSVRENASSISLKIDDSTTNEQLGSKAIILAFDKENAKLQDFIKNLPTDSKLVANSSHDTNQDYYLSIVPKSDAGQAVVFEVPLRKVLEVEINQNKKIDVQITPELKVQNFLVAVINQSDKQSFTITNQITFPNEGMGLARSSISFSSSLTSSSHSNSAGRESSTSSFISVSSSSALSSQSSSAGRESSTSSIISLSSSSTSTSQPSSSSSISSSLSSNSSSSSESSYSSSSSSGYDYNACEEGTCKLKHSDQAREDECSSSTECYHFDCTENFTCEKILSPGTDDDDCPSSNYFGACGRTVCEAGACVKKAGTTLQDGETACDEFGNGSECNHLECINSTCTTVPSVGEHSADCLSDDDGSPIPGRNCVRKVCGEGGTCTLKSGGTLQEGEVSCNESEDCWHNECDGRLCVSKLGSAEDECTTDNAEGKCWHYECTDNLKCEAVLGAGPAGNERQCNPGQDENVCWHRDCSSENSCKKVAGAGAHTCDQDWGENGCKHTGCSNGATTSITDNTCEVISGKGPIGCPIEDVGGSAGVCWHSWCSIDTPGGRCAYWSGPGDVACHRSSDCPGWLDRCRGAMPNWECPTMPNPLKSCEEMFEDACRSLLPDLSSNENNDKSKKAIARLDITRARARLAEKVQEKNPTVPQGEKPVTIEVFQDITCGMCNFAFKNIIPQIAKNYVSSGKVKIVYRQYPLIPEGRALAFAKAAHCAGIENKHDELVGILYSKAKEAKKEELVTYAKSIGVNESKFTTCLNSPQTTEAINANIRDGESRGIKGTPTFFLNGEKIEGAQPVGKFTAKIEELMAM